MKQGVYMCVSFTTETIEWLLEGRHSRCGPVPHFYTVSTPYFFKIIFTFPTGFFSLVYATSSRVKLQTNFN